MKHPCLSACALILALGCASKSTGNDTGKQANSEGGGKPAASTESVHQASTDQPEEPETSSAEPDDTTQEAVTSAMTAADSSVPTASSSEATTSPSDAPCVGGGCDAGGCAEGETTTPFLPDECVRVCRTALEGISLASDADVSELAEQDCVVLDGPVAITQGVTSLVGLETIRVITGSLSLTATTDLSSLQGLDALEHLGGSLVLSENAALVSLDALEAVRHVAGGVVATGNTALQSFAALEGATFARASFTLAGNPELVSLEGLSGVDEVDSIVVADHPKLTTVAGLANVTSLQAITVTNNLALERLELAKLATVGNFTLAANEALTLFTADALTTAMSMILTSNPDLETISLSKLEAVDSLTIADNAVLSDIGELESLSSGQYLTIVQNPSLPQCAVDVIAERLNCSACQGNDTNAVCD